MNSDLSSVRQASIAASTWSVVLLMLASTSGCSSESQRDRELTKIARDWSMTIRASQVLPVYPLTEDLLPGDVFLTTTPIGQEQQFFREKGFLPFDNLVVRLAIQPTEGDSVLRPLVSSMYGTTHFSSSPGSGTDFSTPVAWPSMPRAGFPTYNVSVRRSGGFNVAIPIQGVPLGLSLLGADRAIASVTLKDAYTYGVEIAEINRALEAWASTAKAASFLAPYATFDDDPSRGNFLRVVSRVYLVKKVNVSITSGDAVGGAAQFGGAAAPGVLDANVASAADNAKKLNDTMTAATPSALNPVPVTTGAVGVPSASFRFLLASDRGVSMDEEFARPLAVGYLAVDRQILAGGRLGPALKTLIRVDELGARSERHTSPERTRSNATMLNSIVQDLVANSAKSDAQAKDLLDVWQAQLQPPRDLPTSIDLRSFNRSASTLDFTRAVNVVAETTTIPLTARLAEDLSFSIEQLRRAAEEASGRTFTVPSPSGPASNLGADDVRRLADEQELVLNALIESLTAAPAFEVARQRFGVTR